MPSLPSSLPAGHEPSADEFQAMIDILAAISGQGAPASTTTDTGSLGATEGQDTNLGNITVTVPTNSNNWRYQVNLTNFVGTSGTAGDKYLIRLRDGGAGAPTNTSTLLSETLVTTQVANQPMPISPPGTFTLASGTHTIGLFVKRASGANTMTASSSAAYTGSVGRSMYCEFVSIA